MINVISKLFYLIKLVNLKNRFILLNFFLLLNLFFELIGIGLLIPLINLTVDPDSFASLMSKLNLFDISIDSQRQLAIFFTYLVLAIFCLKISIGLIYLWILQNFVVEFDNRLSVKTLKKYYFFFDSYFLKKTEDLFTSVSFRTTSTAQSSIYLASLISEVIIFSIIFIFLLITSSNYALFSGALLFLISYLIFKFSNLRIKKYSEERSFHLRNKNNLLKEFLDGLREVIVYFSGKTFIQKFEKENLKFLNPQKKIGFLNSAPKFVFESLLFLIVFLTLLNFSYQEQPGNFLFEIGIFVVLIIRIVPSITRILLNYNNFRYAHEPIEVISADLKISEKKPENNDLDSFDKEIQISDLEFSYPLSNTIFKDINFLIKKNEKLIFFGDSGVGKSTLIDLIIGILSPNKGSILIDNKYSPNLNMNWLKLISYVPQKSYIHNNSLKFNITFKETDDLINKDLYNLSLEISGLNDILKDGFNENKNIGQFGSNISGGQRQRVSLARAIYKNAPIIIIDEATNALDIDSEKKILDKLLELKNKTIIFITHRNNNISNFDKFYKLENNRILEVKKNEIENI
tara:strand:- start:1060 stop:2781 length:1722 start_codon:yes stop_codon:yes gene_type:complete